MFSSRENSSKKMVHHQAQVAQQLGQLVADPVNAILLSELLDHVNENYSRPVNSWLTWWLYVFTRTRIEESNAVSQIVNFSEYDPELLLTSVTNMFSKGGWKSTSWNTNFMHALLTLVQEKGGYDADEIISEETLHHLKTLLIVQIDLKLLAIKRDKLAQKVMEQKKVERVEEANSVNKAGISQAAKKNLHSFLKGEANKKQLESFKQYTAPPRRKLDKKEFSEVTSCLASIFLTQKKVGKLAKHPDLKEAREKVRGKLYPSAVPDSLFNRQVLKIKKNEAIAPLKALAI
ncbi:MAG: hypothetical protein A3E85_04045 [Gammaproteobacteria bacterium RIFCSPHIGHO2_12_FULL_45_12]|nr:MAG: hypothetical protein A3E85_04045 [Gammaproteobacteria bacterium RIFCSPHIGHO2_12_FULL_45_12]